jgi:hypothetical protein
VDDRQQLIQEKISNAPITKILGMLEKEKNNIDACSISTQIIHMLLQQLLLCN